ncbi:glucosamine-6-phosphate deaminase [Christensenella intestinihominis]|uniref:glucosamine-6-phosphate deaminase n=1 Tax=Christensenella intestinihominis TaxID=1851429 RepID=UPI0009F701BA|nr:glucosamine-6-phosphate deaminase [Christensenella intestinihominis]
MEFILSDTYEQMSGAAAEILAKELKRKPNAVFALPTGSTPIGTYQALAKQNREGQIDFSQGNFFNVDEYVGLSRESEQGYYHFLYTNLYQHVNVDLAKTHAPDGTAADPELAAIDYERQIDSLGGLDVAFLGIGRNGHIGFNEPADSLHYATYCVTLTESTIEANARFFASVDEMPKQALTIGIGTIMKADKIVMVAHGEDKAEAIRRLKEDTSLNTGFPSSLLRLHPDVTVVTTIK